jgi:amino-acid N-acetyltransferase
LNPLVYRRARPSDTRSILNLIGHYSAKGLMLPRSFAQVVEKVRDFNVALDGGDGTQVKGIVALHVVGEDLAEVRSLAVAEELQGKGVGRQLMEMCLKDAQEMRLPRIFTLTYQTAFFDKLGFTKVEKLTLPQKIWGDCVHCAKFSDCDEIAMVKAVDR